MQRASTLSQMVLDPRNILSFFCYFFSFRFYVKFCAENITFNFLFYFAL